MRIIHLVLGKANPNRMNGVNKVVHQLALAQHKLGMSVEVWGIANSLTHNYPARPFSTRLFQQASGRLGTLDTQLKKALAELSEVAVFHLHGAFIPAFYRVSRLLEHLSLPYVFTPHGSYSKGAMQQNSWVKRIYFHLFEKKLLNKAAAIQLLGIREYEDLDALGTFEQKVLIANGQDLADIPVQATFLQKEFTIGFLGRLDKYHKGLDILLDGFSRYVHAGGKAQLLLIGDGKDRKELEQQAVDLGLKNRVLFAGAIYGDDKYSVLSGAQLFVHTSRMEGFPMAVLEAAAMGLPCLCSEATSMNDFLRKHNAGFALAENTPANIAAALQQAEEQFYAGKLEETGQNARQMIADHFSWGQIARQVIDVYQGVIFSLENL